MSGIKRAARAGAVIVSMLGPAGAAALAPPAAAEVLRIGTEGTYRPWNMIDASGNITGFDADIGREICRRIGAQCRFAAQTFDSLVPALAAGRFGMVLSSLSISDARRRQIDFSLPYARLENRFVVRRDSPLAKITGKAALFAALKGQRLGVQNATTHAVYAEKHLQNTDLRTYDTFDNLLMDLSDGRLDAAFADSASWSAYLARPEVSRRLAYVPVVIPLSDDYAALGGGIAVGLPKGRAELRRRVNAAICAMEADGTVQRFSEKWFNGINVAAPCPPGAAEGAGQ